MNYKQLEKHRLEDSIVITDYLSLSFSTVHTDVINKGASILSKQGRFRTYLDAKYAILSVPTDVTNPIDFLLNDSWCHPVVATYIKNNYCKDKCNPFATLDGDYYKNYLKGVSRAWRNAAMTSDHYATVTHSCEQAIMGLVDSINDYVLLGNEEKFQIRKRKSGMFNYEFSAALMRDGDQRGVIAWGAGNGGCFISLTGSGCAGLNMQRMHDVLKKIPSIKVTRWDGAYDDFNGVRPVEHYVEQYRTKGFNCGNVFPSYKHITSGNIKDGQLSNCGGQTFYVGSRATKLCRVYEKGIQTANETFKKWVRVEVEFHSKDRDIPLDCIINPARYLSGAYPCLSFISDGDVTVIEMTDRNLMGAVEHQVKHASISYGKLIAYLRNVLQIDDSELLDMLAKDCSVYQKRIQRATVTTDEYNLPVDSAVAFDSFCANVGAHSMPEKNDVEFMRHYLGYTDCQISYYQQVELQRSVLPVKGNKRIVVPDVTSHNTHGTHFIPALHSEYQQYHHYDDGTTALIDDIVKGNAPINYKQSFDEEWQNV